MMETCARTGMSKSTIRREEAKGNFPQRIQLSPNRVGFIESEVDDWIAARAAARTADERGNAMHTITRLQRIRSNLDRLAPLLPDDAYSESLNCLDHGMVTVPARNGQELAAVLRHIAEVWEAGAPCDSIRERMIACLTRCAATAEELDRVPA